jgi:hypothetical protein
VGRVRPRAGTEVIGAGNRVFVPYGTTAYMNAIKKEVALAEHDHLVVVINDQTETSNLSFQLASTPGTETFWKDIIKVYGSDK